MRLKFDALKSAPFHAHHYDQVDVNVHRISSSSLTAVLKKLRSESKLNNPFYVALNLGLCFRVGYLVIGSQARGTRQFKAGYKCANIEPLVNQGGIAKALVYLGLKEAPRWFYTLNNQRAISGISFMATGCDIISRRQF